MCQRFVFDMPSIEKETVLCYNYIAHCRKETERFSEKGECMNPWVKKNKSTEVCAADKSGLRIRYPKNMDMRLRLFYRDFAEWLRRNYDFSVRVNVYLKDREYIRASDGENVSALFFGPFDLSEIPFVRIAVGDFGSWLEKDSSDSPLFNALCTYAASLAHELTHYYQWRRDMRLSEVQEERQAEYYSRKVVYEYLNDRGYDFYDYISEQFQE